MIGAQALMGSLVGAGVDTCFMNPGTSEMHFVSALDSVPTMRGVLALFEGVATGAADGYARIAGRPAAVLLHLGPGLANGLANLHNARRARCPIVTIVGAHATSHVRFDSPLQSDIEALARTVSGWVHTCGTSRDLAQDAMRAVAAARRGQIATLVLPADVSWSDGAAIAPPRPGPSPEPPDASLIEAAAALLARGSAGPAAMFLLGGNALTERGLAAASRISAATGARLLAETFPARMEGGAGIPAVGRLAYLAEQAGTQLAGLNHLILAGARAPVSFFGYPGRPSDLVPAGCEVTVLAEPDQDARTALELLAGQLAAGTSPVPASAAPPALEPGSLTAGRLASAIAASLPEHAIISDEANTSGAALPQALARAPRHSLLTLTGGAIGQGLPVATGAAVAAPDRPVLALEADGSALYTIQALWTQAREQLNVTTVVLNNAAYAILRMELARTAAGEAGERASRMLDLSGPTPGFAEISTGMGVPATRVRTAEDLDQALRRAYAEPGPHLIEAVMSLRLAEQLGQLGVEVQVARLLPGRDHLVRPLQELLDRPGAHLELGLPERGAHGDIQDRVPGSGRLLGSPRGRVTRCRRRPCPDIADTLAGVQGRGEQVAGEGPLHRLIRARVKGHPDRVRIRAAVGQAGRQRHDHVLGPDQPQAQLR
jgi:acetolactate synthase-1/2/3 large subunit